MRAFLGNSHMGGWTSRFNVMTLVSWGAYGSTALWSRESPFYKFTARGGGYAVRFPLTQPLPLAGERRVRRRFSAPTIPSGIATIAAISSTA